MVRGPRALLLADLVRLDRVGSGSSGSSGSVASWAAAVGEVRAAVAELRVRTDAQAAWLGALGAALGSPAALRPLARLQDVTLETLDGCLGRLAASPPPPRPGGAAGAPVPPVLYATARDMQGCNSMHAAFEATLVEALTPHRGALLGGGAAPSRAVGRVLACRVAQSVLLRQVQRTCALGARALEGTGLPPGHDGAPALVAVYGSPGALADGLRALLDGSAAEARTVCERTYGHAPEIAVDVAVREAGGGGGPAAGFEAELRLVPSHLAHVANELMKNALEASLRGRGAGGVRVVATVHGDAVDVEVADDGPGVADDRLRTAFDFLASSSGVSAIAGTDAERGGHVSGGRYHVQPPLSGLGVGLAISRALVGHFGGTLALANDVARGRGAVASVRLPLRAAAQAESWTDGAGEHAMGSGM